MSVKEPDDAEETGADQQGLTRRSLILGTAATAGAALLGSLARKLPAQPSRTPQGPQTPQASTAPATVTKGRPVGAPTSAMSGRSPFEQPARAPTGQVTGASWSPLQDFSGTITPTDLHFERHHSGVPTIDPAGADDGAWVD